jgi:RNA-directed DNA polymerase
MERVIVYGWVAAIAVLMIPATALAFFLLRHIYLCTTNGFPWHWLRAKIGLGMNSAELARRLQVEELSLRSLDVRYRDVEVPKKRGGRRLLSIPAPELKRMQRRILQRLLRRLRAHPVARGYEAGKSIVANAAPHVGRAVVIKMDLVDFFPRTSAQRIEAYFRRIGWNREAAALLTHLCTYAGGLPQGAPTSPRLSNLINFGLDRKLQRYVLRRKGVYTRYADDITISFPEDYPHHVRGTIQWTRRLARALGYEIHVRRKLRVLRPHQQQRVTGLVVNEKLQLPRARRRWLRAVEHHLRAGRPATLSPEQLQGWRAFQAMIRTNTGSKPDDNQST